MTLSGNTKHGVSQRTVSVKRAYITLIYMVSWDHLSLCCSAVSSCWRCCHGTQLCSGCSKHQTAKMFRQLQRRSFEILCIACSKHSGYLADTRANRNLSHLLATCKANQSLPSFGYTPPYARTCSKIIWESDSISTEALKKEQDRKQRIDAASHILQQVAARKLNQHLKEESKVRLCMPVDEALEKAKEFGAACGDDEVCSLALHAIQREACHGDWNK